MSENLQVKAILEHIETRERELADQAGQFRDRIAELTRQLGELDAESENLRITRKTLLTLPCLHPPPGRTAPTSRTTPPTSRSSPPWPTRAGRCAPRDLCQALDLPILPKNTEGIRSKLKRLVSRGILTEPEPGLFARPDA
ncbi:hypothetical protein [Streptomyces sp. NBC_00391]|uniref:hypothetical protein n=1 Tax=Streptomyces sp. NBC_00391 TaxID=2903647 RepID=UPI002E237260